MKRNVNILKLWLALLTQVGTTCDTSTRMTCPWKVLLLIIISPLVLACLLRQQQIRRWQVGRASLLRNDVYKHRGNHSLVKSGHKRFMCKLTLCDCWTESGELQATLNNLLADAAVYQSNTKAVITAADWCTCISRKQSPKKAIVLSICSSVSSYFVELFLSHLLFNMLCYVFCLIRIETLVKWFKTKQLLCSKQKNL